MAREEQQFALTEHQRAIRDMARGFAAEEIAPHAIEWDQRKHFPADVIRRAAALGMGGICVREEIGGSGLARLDATLIFEALAEACLPPRPFFPSTTWSRAWSIVTATSGSGTRWRPVSAPPNGSGATA